MGYSLSNIEEYNWRYKYILEYHIDIFSTAISILIKSSEITIKANSKKLSRLKSLDETLNSLTGEVQSQYESQIYGQYHDIESSISENCRLGVFLAIFRNFEIICRGIESDLLKNNTLLSDGREFLRNLKSVLTEKFDIAYSEFQNEYQKVKSLSRLRNYLTHSSGFISIKEADKLGPILFNGIQVDKSRNLFALIKIEKVLFLEEALEAVCDFIFKISELIEKKHKK